MADPRKNLRGVLHAPDGQTFEVDSLMRWCRDNEWRFPPDLEGDVWTRPRWKRAAGALCTNRRWRGWGLVVRCDPVDAAGVRLRALGLPPRVNTVLLRLGLLDRDAIRAAFLSGALWRERLFGEWCHTWLAQWLGLVVEQHPRPCPKCFGTGVVQMAYKKAS